MVLRFDEEFWEARVVFLRRELPFPCQSWHLLQMEQDHVTLRDIMTLSLIHI